MDKNLATRATCGTVFEALQRNQGASTVYCGTDVFDVRVTLSSSRASSQVTERWTARFERPVRSDSIW